jgi:hypothetical protein
VERDRGALGAADDGAGDVERGDCRRSAWENEASQRGEAGVERVDVMLEALDLARNDPQRAFDLAGRGDIGAEVEQFVLDA